MATLKSCYSYEIYYFDYFKTPCITLLSIAINCQLLCSLSTSWHSISQSLFVIGSIYSTTERNAQNAVNTPHVPVNDRREASMPIHSRRQGLNRKPNIDLSVNNQAIQPAIIRWRQQSQGKSTRISQESRTGASRYV